MPDSGVEPNGRRSTLRSADIRKSMAGPALGRKSQFQKPGQGRPSTKASSGSILKSIRQSVFAGGSEEPPQAPAPKEANSDAKTLPPAKRSFMPENVLLEESPSTEGVEDSPSGNSHLASPPNTLPEAPEAGGESYDHAALLGNGTVQLKDEGQGESDEPPPKKDLLGTWKRRVKGILEAKRTITQAQDDVDLIYGDRAEDWDNRNSHWTRRYVIGLEHPFRIVWDLSQVIILTYVAVTVPLNVAFSYTSFGLAFWVEVFVDLYFYVDIVINFFSVVRVENEMEVLFLDDVRTIGWNYIKGWFVLDVLACLPLDYISRGSEGTLLCSFALKGCPSEDSDETSSQSQVARALRLIRILRLLKLMRLTRIVRILDRYQDKLVYWQHFLVCCKVFGVTMFFSHWMGCLYGVVYEWEDENLTEKWVASFYWAVQTITTVGYGDRTQDTIEGRMVSALGMTLGGVIFSWFMSNIFTLLNPDPAREKHQETMQYVVAYLQNNRLPIDVAARVLSYFRKQGQTTSSFDEEKLLNTLPFHLRQELFDHLYGHVIRSIPMFARQEDRFVNELCFSVTPMTCFQYELIYQIDELGDSMYMLVEGDVSLLREVDRRHILKGVLLDTANLEKNTITTFKSKGAYFGEATVLGYSTRIEYALVKDFAKLLVLPAKQFQDLLEIYPKVRETMLNSYVSRLRTFSSKEIQAQVVRSLNLEQLLEPPERGREGPRGIRKDFKRLIHKMDSAEVLKRLYPERKSMMVRHATYFAGVDLTRRDSTVSMVSEADFGAEASADYYSRRGSMISEVGDWDDDHNASIPSTAPFNPLALENEATAPAPAPAPALAPAPVRFHTDDTNGDRPIPSPVALPPLDRSGYLSVAERSEPHTDGTPLHRSGCLSVAERSGPRADGAPAASPRASHGAGENDTTQIIHLLLEMKAQIDRIEAQQCQLASKVEVVERTAMNVPLSGRSFSRPPEL